MLSGGYENQRARIDNGIDQFCYGRDQYCTECHFDLRKTGYYPDGCPGCSNSDIKCKDDRTGLLYPDFQPSGLHPSVSDPSVSKKPGTGTGFPEMRNADSRCVFWGVGFTSYSSFMGHLGVDAAAANSVAAVVRDIICCLSAGISGAAGIMVGNELGAGNLKRGKLYGTRMMKISFVCGVAMMVLMGISAPFILHFVKLTPQAAVYLKGMFVVLCVYMIGRSVNEITINGVFGSGGDTMFDVYSLAVTMWGIAIPLAALGTYRFHWPVIVVYACTCIDEVGKIPWTLYHFRKYKWVKDLTHTGMEQKEKS